MERLAAHEARVIHLAWDSERRVHEIRLMYGKRYLTPKLYMSALDWHHLLGGGSVRFDGWFVLGRDKSEAIVAPLREFVYEGSRDVVPASWPRIRFKALYDAAARTRGGRPEKGWEKLVEAEIEAKRGEWGPA